MADSARDRWREWETQTGVVIRIAVRVAFESFRSFSTVYTLSTELSMIPGIVVDVGESFCCRKP